MMYHIISWPLPRMVIPPLPWAAHSNPWLPFQWRNYPWCVTRTFPDIDISVLILSSYCCDFFYGKFLLRLWQCFENVGCGLWFLHMGTVLSSSRILKWRTGVSYSLGFIYPPLNLQKPKRRIMGFRKKPSLSPYFPGGAWVSLWD